MPKSSAPGTTTRQPRAQKVEWVDGTIGIQKRVIDDLTSRLITVAAERDQVLKDLRSALGTIEDASIVREKMSVKIESLNWDLSKLSDVHTRMLGWQDCARELIEKIGKP